MGLHRGSMDQCDLASYDPALGTAFGGRAGGGAAAKDTSMAHAAAGAVAAVDGEHRLAVASGPDRGSGSSAALDHAAAVGGQWQQGKMAGAAGGEALAMGGHPQLRISTGKGVKRGSGEAGRASPACSDLEGGAQSSSRADPTDAVLGCEDGSSGLSASPLASPKVCSTPAAARGGAHAGLHTALRRELECMSSYHIQRAYAAEARRASMPDILLRGQRPLERHSGGGSSGGSSSIRSPSSYAMANAIQAQIDAVELRCTQQQQQQQQQQQEAGHGREENAEEASRQLCASGSGGSGGSAGHQRSLTSDALVGEDARQKLQQQVGRRMCAWARARWH